MDAFVEKAFAQLRYPKQCIWSTNSFASVYGEKVIEML
jgi:hypothetical protein